MSACTPLGKRWRMSKAVSWSKSFGRQHSSSHSATKRLWSSLLLNQPVDSRLKGRRWTTSDPLQTTCSRQQRSSQQVCWGAMVKPLKLLPITPIEVIRRSLHWGQSGVQTTVSFFACSTSQRRCRWRRFGLLEGPRVLSRNFRWSSTRA